MQVLARIIHALRFSRLTQKYGRRLAPPRFARFALTILARLSRAVVKRVVVLVTALACASAFAPLSVRGPPSRSSRAERVP